MSDPFLTAQEEEEEESLMGVSADPEPSEPVDGDQLLHDITQFIGRYLQCSEHQRAVLALWVLHTGCHYTAQVTPYLSIQSGHKQSGKTLCLQLLSLLCENPALSCGGLTPQNLALRMKVRPVSCILLDECHATLGARTRSKAPALRALLAGSFDLRLGYTRGLQEENIFCPKAFAGRGQLPEELADRSIPIILHPLKEEQISEIKNLKMPETPSNFGDFANAACHEERSRSRRGNVGNENKSEIRNQNSETSTPCSLSPVPCPLPERFHLRRAVQEAEPLQERLSAWSEAMLPVLEMLPPYDQDQFPPNLSPRRQDMCEPLLQLADTVGGEWPARIREALVAVFEEQAVFDLQPNLQLLTDLHQCFFHHGFPERLSTADLLAWTHTLPTRLWDVDGPLSAHRLARLLAAFDIRPRVQRNGKVKVKPARGYQLADFLEPWRTHLGAAPPNWAAPGQRKDWSTRLAEYEIAAKNKGCNGVAHAGEPCVPSENNSDTPPGMSEQALPSNLSRMPRPSVDYPIPNLPSYQIPQEAPASEIANKNDVCNGVAVVDVLSVPQPIPDPIRNGQSWL